MIEAPLIEPVDFKVKSFTSTPETGAEKVTLKTMLAALVGLVPARRLERTFGAGRLYASPLKLPLPIPGPPSGNGSRRASCLPAARNPYLPARPVCRALARNIGQELFAGGNRSPGGRRARW